MNHISIHLRVRSRYIEREDDLFYLYDQVGDKSELQEFLKKKPIIKVPVAEIEWILENPPRPINVNKKFSLSKPIPILWWEGKLIPLTDFDQIWYAKQVGAKMLPMKLLSHSELVKMLKISKVAYLEGTDLKVIPESYLIPVDIEEPLEKLEEVLVTEELAQLVPTTPVTLTVEGI